MPRPIWTGTISFGLVNVPVKAYTAVRDHDVHFHQLDKKSGARIRNEKVSEKTGREVDSDDIEMGFEIRKGKYVTFDKDELDELRPESTRAIEVTDFVALDDDRPDLLRAHLLARPRRRRRGKEAYRLLLAAMEDRERVGIGTVVMRNKQYLAADPAARRRAGHVDDALRRRGRAPLRDRRLPSRRAKPDAKALKHGDADHRRARRRLGPKQYHDTYTEELRDRIKPQGQGQGGRRPRRADEGDAKVLDLMAALEASVDAAKKRRTPRKSTRKPARKSA